jgi:hypothetical protein
MGEIDTRVLKMFESQLLDPDVIRDAIGPATPGGNEPCPRRGYGSRPGADPAPGRRPTRADALRRRDAELDQLRRAQQLAGTGHGQLAAVVGEAGVGKSRLVYEFTHSHRLHGWLAGPRAARAPAAHARGHQAPATPREPPATFAPGLRGPPLRPSQLDSCRTRVILSINRSTHAHYSDSLAVAPTGLDP